MEEGRQRKIEAGKAKLAEFKKKKKQINISSPPSSISSSDSQKSCPIDPGSGKDKYANLNNQEKAVMDSFTSEDANSNLTNSPVKDSTISSTNQCSTDSSSLESFLVEGTVEELEISSGSDNSTITRNSSDSSKSCSTTENENKPHIKEGKLFQFERVSQPTVPSDCRPDEEKILESSLAEEKEKEVSEMESSLGTKEKMAEVISSDSGNNNQEKEASEMKHTLSTKEKIMKFSSIDFKTNNKEMELPQFLFGEENKIKKNYATDIAVKDNSLILNDDVTTEKDIPLLKHLSLPEPEDDRVSLLNADDTELVSLYEKKIEKYKEAIQQRDTIISQLSNRLESVIANQNANLVGNSEVDMLQVEINLLHLKMKETSELLKKQKLKNGSQEFENCSSQTDVELLSRSVTGVQVEGEMKSLHECCDLSDITFSELFRKMVPANSDSLHEMVLQLHQFLTSQFSHVQIQELMTLLKTDINLPEFDPVPERTETALLKNKLHISEKLDSTAILKKITSLNMVAKVIESLVSLSSGDANETFPDFSPSKFQSFFLKRLHSVEGGDTLPDASENESIVSDYNYAEVETPCLKRDFESSVSIEKLRKRNISEDFCLVTEFLQDEMDRLCNFILPNFHSGPQGDGPEHQESLDAKECLSTGVQIGEESDHKQILLHKLKLETRLKNLKLLDKELHGVQSILHQASIDSDTMTMSEDNLMMEELPLSCISLLSLTDSEYKGENIVTDSDTNYSRKVSIDMSRSMQERDLCIKCERTFDLWKEKYENEVISMKASLESSYNTQKSEFLESIKNLEYEIEQLKMDKKNLNEELNQQIELLCSENKMKISHLTEQHQQKLAEITLSQNKYHMENKELETKLKELEGKLTYSNRKIMDTADERAKIEIELQNQIADLIQEHEQDMESLRLENETKLNLEMKQLENHYKSSVEVLKEVHGGEINELKCQIKREFKEREQNLLNEHSRTISMIEAAHNDESAVYQKKIEQLLEEKCELLTKTTHEYETILKKNHKALVILCKQLLSKINVEKEKLLNESLKSCTGLEVSFSGAFNELNRDLENGLFKFLNQNYFMNSNNEEFNLDDTEYLPIEINYPLDEDNMLLKSDLKDVKNTNKKNEITQNKQDFKSSADGIPSESTVDSDDLYTIHTEINKLQKEFQKDVAFYKNVNDQLHLEIKKLRKQIEELEEQKGHLENQLQEKDKDLVSKESLLTAMNTAAVKGDTQLSATDIRSWQVQAAQTNSRLLHVLSDLVKTFLDIENDINSHLLEYGLISSRAGTLNQHDDDTGQSVGSREDFASLSLGDCPNLELTEDGPDLTPRAWDVFITAGNYEADLEGEDVVLGASRRLRMAVDHVLNLLSRALENQQNQDLKLLLKRNEELSHELQEESQGRDAVNMELLTAESTIRKLESEKQQLQDLHADLKEDYGMLKRELSVERNKISHLQQEKESAFDEIHVLKEQCELLASRLGDPEKTENDKMFSSSGTCMHENSELLQENSRLSSEKQIVQKNLSKERQSFLDRLHQMEIALEELNAEKDDLMEKKCKEIRDLKAEMEAMEKQLHSNRKFIEEQALEREQEREEFIKEINRMQDFVREKEKIQSNETQLTKEIESLEQLLRVRIEDHKNAMTKKDEVEKELRQSLDKIRDLRDVIEEYGKQIDIKTRTEAELRQKLSVIYESIPYQEKNTSNSDSDSSRNIHVNGESMEHLHNLKEQLASQSQEIEIMSQSQTLLHELRGQIHFLEAKVEQRAKQLETSILSSGSSPVQSGATSPSGSQDSESLQIPCEDGWQMSPRSIHWLEVRRLEEKIGRLVHIDEELLKKNKELEQQFKKIKSLYLECQHENAALQEKLSEQLVQISALKSHIDEQKHRCSTPQKTHSFAEKIEELQEELEKHIETNKRLLVDLCEAETTVNALQEEIHKKDEMIAALTECAGKNVKQDAVYDEGDSELSSIEEIQNQLVEKIKLMKSTDKENKDLKNEIDLLKTENSSLTTLLRKAENETEMEKAQVESLCEEITNITENSNEGDESLNNSITNDSKEESFNEGIQDIDPKLKSWETRIKEKNLEILMLRATVTKLESTLRLRERELELEQVQVETLLQELGSLTGYQRRLEQDFNIVQDMMQQKEKELTTLHEETDAQMKFEAEIESLEKELSDQRNVELELREEIQNLESQLSLLENLKTENEKKDLYIKNIEESHKEKISILNKQIDLLKVFNTESEWDPNIEELVKKITEVANTCKINDTEEHAFQEIIFNVLKNAVDSILKQMKHEHEDHVVMLNKSWQEKVNEELASKEKMFKIETENLQNAFQSEKEKLNVEKDLFWKEKIKKIELQRKNEQLKYEKLCDYAKVSKTELQGMFTNEINTLRENLESVVEEKISLESLINDLKCELEHFKLNETNQNATLSKEYESKLSAFSKTIKETFEKEKEKMINLHQQKIDQLQTDLNLKLEKEKIFEMKHKEELSALHKYFESRWANEMKKVKDFQSEDLKNLKDNNQKILDEKLKKVEEKFTVLLTEERKHLLFQHRKEIEALQENFEEDKKTLLEEKDKALKDATDIVEKKFNSNLTEIQKKLSNECKFPGESNQKRWEEEKLKLISSHRKEMSVLKRELKNRFEKQLQNQATAHAAEIQKLEEVCNKQVEEVHDRIKEAKHTASKTGYSECGSNRTTTPSSDMTSSDEACSSCREDMLSVNKQILVDKIHQDGKRVLSLIENVAQPVSYMKEAHLWLEERNWIINKLKTVSPATSNENLKLVISNLVDEVQKFRINFETAMEENSDLKQKCDELEHQLSIQYSNICDVNSQLKKQKERNSDLEILLSSKTSELTELQRRHSETKRFEKLSTEKETYTTNSSSSGSYEIEHFRSSEEPRFARLSAEKELYTPSNENIEYSYEVGGFRSADEPRFVDKFSMYHTEIDNTPSMEQHTPNNKVTHTQDSTIPKSVDSPLLSVHNVSPPEEVNDMSKIKEKLMAVLNKGTDTRDTKLHELYWVYRRSQSYNKALIYQKKYLLMLLRGFQMTEKVTLAWLKNMDSPGSNTTLTDSSLSGRSRFRVVVFVIIALQRMKFYIRRWRLFAKIPPSHVINIEIQSVFQNYSFLSPGGFHLSSHSLASMPVSLVGGDCRSSQISESSRSEIKFKSSMNPDKSQLIEYVHRLETLQKQLGLDNFR